MNVFPLLIGLALVAGGLLVAAPADAIKRCIGSTDYPDQCTTVTANCGADLEGISFTQTCVTSSNR